MKPDFPIYISSHRRDDMVVCAGSGAEIHVGVHALVRDGTLAQIFQGFELPLAKVGLTPEQCAFFGQKYNGFLDEDHATLVLRNGPHGLDIVRFELDNVGKVDEQDFSLDNPWVFRASHGHLVVVPTGVMKMLGLAA